MRTSAMRTNCDKLADLDFANDIFLKAEVAEGLQLLIDRLYVMASIASRLGLLINGEKYKQMNVDTRYQGKRE